jgi:hypothetical protein
MQKSSSKQIDLSRDFAAGVYLSDAHNPIPTHPLHNEFVYTVYLLTQGGWGGVEPERRLERQQFTKLGRKYQHD